MSNQETEANEDNRQEVRLTKLEKDDNDEPVRKSSPSKVDLKRGNNDQEIQELEKNIEEAKKGSKIFSALNLQKFFMEFLGSFAIVYFGNWAQIFSDLGLSNPIAVSLTIGMFMSIFTWVGEDISGAHFNPITTVRNSKF